MTDFRLPRLQRTIPIVDRAGNPALAFQRWWQSFAETIETQETTQNATIAELQEVVDAVTLLAADLAGYVAKDQEAAPTYTPYAGQVVSAVPTQAEVQAIDDAVVTLAAAVADLITALQTADVLT